MNMKSEVDTQIASLQEQICELSRMEKVTESSDVPDYNECITLLRYALERYTNFDSDEDISEAVIVLLAATDNELVRSVCLKVVISVFCGSLFADSGSLPLFVEGLYILIR